MAIYDLNSDDTPISVRTTFNLPPSDQHQSYKFIASYKQTSREIDEFLAAGDRQARQKKVDSTRLSPYLSHPGRLNTSTQQWYPYQQFDFRPASPVTTRFINRFQEDFPPY